MACQSDVDSMNFDAAVASREAAMFAGSPHVVLKPRIFPDGDMWCVLLGENLQEGICGFGETPARACSAFDQAWYHGKTPAAARTALAKAEPSA